MSGLLSILKGVAVAFCLVAVIVVGTYYDTLQYEERHPEKQKKKEHPK